MLSCCIYNSRQQWHRSDSAAAAPSWAAQGCAQQAACETGAEAALTCWPGTEAAAGLESLKRACVLRQLCQASLGAKQHPSVAQPRHSTGGFLQLWGRAAPGLRNPASSCSHLSRCQLEGLNTEPDVRQDRLCQLGRPALRGELHLRYPLFLLGAVQVSRMKKENSCA